MKVELTLSIGYSQAKHHEVIEVNDVPEGLSGDALIAWLHENYWVEWAAGYIEGGVAVVEGEEAKGA